MKNWIGFDVETWGVKQEYALQQFRSKQGLSGVRAASFSRDDKASGVLNPTADTLKNVFTKIVEQRLTVVGWNICFDVAWLIALGLEKEVFQTSWLDGMLLWRHAVVEPEGENVPQNKRKSYALEAALKEFFPNDVDFKDFKDFQATDEASLKRLLHRNKEDARFTVKLAELFWSWLTPKQQRVALIEAHSIPQVAWTYVHGLKINKEAALNLQAKLIKDGAEAYQKLVATHPEVEGVNLGSSPQLAKLLFETWGLPSEKVSKKTDNPSTDKYVLTDLAVSYPHVALLKIVRESKNNGTKYAKGSLDSLEYNGDGYTRPQAKIFGTYTSRMTYASKQKQKIVVEKSKKNKETKQVEIELVEKKIELPTGIALHQWKRGKDFRRLIEPPPGYGLLELDAAGQEFRWMAVASRDETMLSLCAPGEDAHSFMGAQVAEVDYRDLIRRAHEEDKEAANQRKCGKFCNLSYQYRVSAKTATVKARIDYEMDVDIDFIQRTQDIYRTSYVGVGGPPGRVIGGYWLDQINKCKMLGYAETFAGRRVQLKGNWSNRNESWALESTAINYPIQGTGGDQKYLAMAVAKNDVRSFDGYFYYELHDGLFYIFPLEKLEKAAHHLRTKLSNLPYKAAWGLDLPIKFPFDGKVGPSWGELKEF